MKEDMKEILQALWREHRGKLVGGILGVVLGVAVLLFGFFATLFVLLTGLMGFAIGAYVDKGQQFSDLQAMMKEIFPYGFARHR